MACGLADRLMMEQGLHQLSLHCNRAQMQSQKGRWDRVDQMKITAENLTCLRNGRSIFKPASFALGAGDFLTLTGINGAGKSTLLRLLAGFLPIADGRLSIDPVPEGQLADLCHYFGHADGLSSSLTVAENLEFWRLFYPDPRLEISAALDAVGLQRLSEVPAAVLSAGQRRRLSFARLLVSYRPVWLLDEPTTALDRDAAEQLFAFIEAQRSGGGIVIAAVHDWTGPAPSQTVALEPAGREAVV